jgi:hypothetical protein
MKSRPPLDLRLRLFLYAGAITGATAVGLLAPDLWPEPWRPALEVYARFAPWVMMAGQLSALAATGRFRRRRTGTHAGSRQDAYLKPPRFGQYLLYLFVPRKIREPLMGDLEEQFEEVAATFGRRKARFWYYVQVARAFWPILAKWGLLAWAGQLFSKLIR